MDNLERRVETLVQLPERVTALEAQIVQLRDEMRSEFSATRAETRAGDEETRRTLREEIRAGDEETRRVLTTRMDDLFGANERHMRVLHEDLVQRIATLKQNRQ
jgi:predicted phage gp36 major capsid-like protein